MTTIRILILIALPLGITEVDRLAPAPLGPAEKHPVLKWIPTEDFEFVKLRTYPAIKVHER